MPRRSRVAGISVPVTRSNQNASVRSANVVGRPPAPVVQQTFPVIVRPTYFKAGVRRLLKRDVSKGLSMPEADALPFIGGVVAAGTASYGGQKIMHLQPMVPPKSGKGRKTIPPPSPTNGGGIRNPYTRKRNR